MNIRQAILKAADSIQQYPELFKWSSCSVGGCNTPGCALGWIDHHLGAKEGDPFGWHSGLFSALEIGNAGRFYDQMRQVSSLPKLWQDNNKVCAKTLRKYADKYHPQTDHIPASVREIFTEQVAA